MRPTVLVLDDERMLLTVLERALRRDVDVVLCEDPVEALAGIKNGRRYSVILCDLSMPTMSGIDFHRALATAAPDQAARTIFLTGGSLDERTHAFLAQVPNAWVNKPFDLRALRTMVMETARDALRPPGPG